MGCEEIVGLCEGFICKGEYAPGTPTGLTSSFLEGPKSSLSHPTAGDLVAGTTCGCGEASCEVDLGQWRGWHAADWGEEETKERDDRVHFVGVPA